MFRFLLVLAMCLVLGPAADAGARPEPWPPFARFDAASTASIDHSIWTRLLATYVRPGPDGIDRVAYAKVTPADRQALASYLDALQKIAISGFNRQEQLAYWINLYNALTVKVVLDHYPVRSIRDIRISPGSFSSGPWGAKLLKVEGQDVALDDIEHRILRPLWHDPRIHYAMTCAALGAPDLQPEAYVAARIDRQLDAAALRFINSRRAVWFVDDRLHLSSLYNWYADDFGGTAQAIIRHLMSYADPALAIRLQRFTEIAGTDYDWTLNDAAP